MSGRIYYPQARASLSFVPYDVRGAVLASSDLITIDDLRPISLSFTSKDSKSAGEWEVELPLRFFAQDPRLFRCVAVDLHLGDTGALDVPLKTSKATRLVLGIADEVEKTADASTASFKLSGRDYKSFLLDEKWQGRRVELGRPLDVILREILDSIPAAAPLGVALDGVPSAPVVPAGKGKKRGVWRGSTDSPVYQEMYAIAVSVGLTLTVEADQVLIRYPRTFTTSDAVPLLLSGHNLSKLSIKRKFGVKELPNIRVSAIDPATRSTISAKWPETARATVKVTKAKEKPKKTSQTIIHDFVIRHNAPTVEILTTIARQVWERFAQQQLEVSFETKDLTAPLFAPERTNQGGAEVSFSDLTRLRNGSPVRIYLAPETQQILEAALTEDDKTRQLIAARYDARVAEVLARGWRALETPLFVDEVTISFEGRSGVSISGKASAYITVSLEEAT